MPEIIGKLLKHIFGDLLKSQLLISADRFLSFSVHSALLVYDTIDLRAVHVGSPVSASVSQY